METDYKKEITMICVCEECGYWSFIEESYDYEIDAARCPKCGHIMEV